MKKLAKRTLAFCLALMLILSMASVVASAESPLEFVTDSENKTVRIQGDLSDLGEDSVSLIIMDPTFTGSADEIWNDTTKIVALDQVALDDGKIDKTVALASITLWENYRVFINGESCTETFRFTGRSYKYSVNAGDTVSLPIIVEDCDQFAGLRAVLKYDSELLTLESIGAKNGFILQPAGNSFIVAHNTGMGLDGTVTVGYAVFTAKADIEDDVATIVTFPANKVLAFDQDGQPAEVTLPAMEVTIVAKPPMRGDVNLDGKVDLADAILLLQYLSKNVELTGRQLKAADVTGDGKIDTADAIVIMQMCL